MKRHHRQFRTMLLTIALGLASVPFFRMIHEKWTEIRVDVPQIESNAPLIVNPYEMLKDSTIKQNRDLSLYELNGGGSLCNEDKSIETRKCEADLEKSRKLIWKNWNTKKQSYFIVNGKYHLFIEPDEKGEWHIAVRSVFRKYSWGDWIDEIDVRSLEFWRDLENGKESKNGRLRLHFIDWEGKGMFSL